MATTYNHKSVEKKWRGNWEAHPINVNDGKKPKYALSHLVTEMNRLFLSVYPFRKETPRRVQLSESAVLHLPTALCKIPAIIYYSFSQSLYIQIFTTKQEYFIIFNRFVKYRFYFYPLFF